MSTQRTIAHFVPSHRVQTRIRTALGKWNTYPTILHHILHERWHSGRHLRSESAVILLLVLLLVTSCSSDRPTVLVKPTPSALPTATSTAGIPSLTPTVLASAPQHCPSSSAPPSSKVFPQGVGGFKGSVTLTGRTPVWNDFPPPPVLYLDYPQTGTKIIWEVGPNYTQPATIRVTNLRTGEPAWWDEGEGGTASPDATRALVLDSHNPNQFYRGEPTPGWQEWGSTLAFVEAGCYALDVSWSSGHWRFIFAVGRSH